MPADLADPPALDDYTEQYWRIFAACSADRPVGLAPGSIPVSAIIAYARDVEGITARHDLAVAIRMVRAIDAEFLSAEAARTPANDQTRKR